MTASAIGASTSPSSYISALAPAATTAAATLRVSVSDARSSVAARRAAGAPWPHSSQALQLCVCCPEGGVLSAVALPLTQHVQVCVLLGLD